MSVKKPDFLIIGAAKSGTTSLATALATHPGIHILPYEVHYFSQQLARGDPWYLSLFDQPGKLQGEKSPTYLYYCECHREIYRLLSRARLIVLLRDPVQRAFSNWNMRYRDKRLITQGLHFNRSHRDRPLRSLDFSALTDYYLENRDDAAVFLPPLDVIQRSLYLPQVESLLRYFPAKQILFLWSEQYFSSEPRGYETVCRFLNIAPQPSPVLARQRQGYYNHTIPQKSQAQLQAFFQPFNRKLFELLGQSCEEWQ